MRINVSNSATSCAVGTTLQKSLTTWTFPFFEREFRPKLDHDTAELLKSSTCSSFILTDGILLFRLVLFCLGQAGAADMLPVLLGPQMSQTDLSLMLQRVVGAWLWRKLWQVDGVMNTLLWVKVCSLQQHICPLRLYKQSHLQNIPPGAGLQ